MSAVPSVLPAPPRHSGVVASLRRAPSVSVTLLALLVFGYVKGRFTGAGAMRSAIQTVVIGGLAAAAAFGIARVVS